MRWQKLMNIKDKQMIKDLEIRIEIEIDVSLRRKIILE